MKIFVVTGLLVISFVSCAEKPKTIPIQTFVEIWFLASETDEILKKHELPVHAPEQKLDPLTRPYGFTARDFKYTYEQIEQDPALKKKRDQAQFEYLQKKLMERLEESKTIVLPDSIKAGGR